MIDGGTSGAGCKAICSHRGSPAPHDGAAIARCADELLAAEQAAREAGRGLWAEAAYQVRQADRPAELLRYRTTFQIVEGRIARVAFVRGVIHLNFDRNWRRAFSVSLRNADRGLLGVSAGDPKGLEGRHVRVRGWIERRGRARPSIFPAAA